MRYITFPAIFLICLASLAANKPPAGKELVLVSDPLKGKTTGDLKGKGEFLEAGGWRSVGGKIVFDAGSPITDGYFECTMSGWTAPAKGADKTHPLSAWETPAEAYTHYKEKGAFWNWRIGEGYQPFKLLSASKGGETRQEARAGKVEAVNDGKPHLYRVEWKDGVVSFHFDGKLIHTQMLDHFAVRIFLVGRDDMYPPTDPAPIISGVKVVQRGEK